MNPDKELLRAAAKAAGFVIVLWERGPHHSPMIEHNNGLLHWNPLLVDKDAFRLAVTLQIDINFLTQFCVIARSKETVYKYPENIDDLFAATRRAIVEVAAKIGQARGVA